MFFISLILILIVVVAIVIGAYYLVIHLIKLWTGCDNDEANAKLHNFFNGSANCTIENDSTVFTERLIYIHFVTHMQQDVLNQVCLQRYCKIFSVILI